MTPNQLVGHNLARIRKLRGWTQAQAAERLEPHLGVRWSNVVWSAAERSWAGRRVRKFDADEIAALAKTFDVPVEWFFQSPREVQAPNPYAIATLCLARGRHRFSGHASGETDTSNPLWYPRCLDCEQFVQPRWVCRAEVS